MKFLIFLSLKLLFKEFERRLFSCFSKSAYSTLSPLLLENYFYGREFNGRSVDSTVV